MATDRETTVSLNEKSPVLGDSLDAPIERGSSDTPPANPVTVVVLEDGYSTAKEDTVTQADKPNIALKDSLVTIAAIDPLAENTEIPKTEIGLRIGPPGPPGPPSSPPGNISMHVKLRHYGTDATKSFVFPFTLCKTWESMEKMIALSYGNDEAAKKEFQEGKYFLHTVNREQIFPEHWDILVQPWMKVIVKLQSQEESDTVSDTASNTASDTGSDSSSNFLSDSESESDSDDAGGHGKQNSDTAYKTKINYTVAYFRKARWTRDPDEFLYSKNYDNATLLKRSIKKRSEVPVLEEKKSVVIPRYTKFHRQKVASMNKPRFNSRDEVGETSLLIHSPLLLNALRSIIKYSSNIPLPDGTDQLKNGEFLYPYSDLFHHKQALLDYKKNIDGPRANHTAEYNAECDRHIDFLIDYLDKEPNVQLETIEANWAKKTPTTTFASLWLLLKPGSDVYVREDGQFNAYVVDSVSHGFGNLFENAWSSNARSYSIHLWNLKYDGRFIKRVSKLIRVPVFDNERDIMSLPLIPAAFQDIADGGLRRQQLIERGKKAFRYFQGPTFLEYTGPGLAPGWKMYNRARIIVEHESGSWNRDEFNFLTHYINGDEHRFDEDQRKIGARARSPRCECNKCTDFDAIKETYISATFTNYDDIDPKKVEELSEHQYMLCEGRMFGFTLKDRTYEIVDVSHLSDVKFAENAIDRLVMRPEANKDTIKAIVQTYGDSSQVEHFSADYIHGKGEGQIFLLHGPPGTGKTLTAESVAEFTRRPLLSITAADLGQEPIDLERNLLRFFKNAHSWDAIVLLDEADIYLERRSSSDLKRNSIVSIFLRAMDYFQGILFLTTNRVGHFDEAFMSRIHLSIGYARLDQKAREQVWDNLFLKLKEDFKNGGPEIGYDYDAKQYVKKNEEVKKLQWNGREIRNAFQTAVALAVFDAKSAKNESIPEITEKHLSQVVNMSAAFKDYITATHEGIEDTDMAYKLGNRYDGE